MRKSRFNRFRCFLLKVHFGPIYVSIDMVGLEKYQYKCQKSIEWAREDDSAIDTFFDHFQSFF